MMDKLNLYRAQYMEFSYPVAVESYKFMVPNPEEESRLLAPIRPFQYAVSWNLFFNNDIFFSRYWKTS